jgi:hypothetical protein
MRQLLFSLVWASTSITHDKGGSRSPSTIYLFKCSLPTVLWHIHTLCMCDAADARSRPNPSRLTTTRPRRGRAGAAYHRDSAGASHHLAPGIVRGHQFQIIRSLPWVGKSAFVADCLISVGMICGLPDCLGPDEVMSITHLSDLIHQRSISDALLPVLDGTSFLVPSLPYIVATRPELICPAT